jgi:hypothetical protein
MDEERLPQKVLNVIPTERRKSGRPKTRWKEGVLRATEECGVQDGDWKDRLRWRLGVERHTYIHTHARADTHVHTCISTYTHTHTHTHTYIHTHKHTYTHTHTYVRTYVHTYIHTYKQTNK